MLSFKTNTLNKYFIITKILFLISPFLYFIYFYMIYKNTNISFYEAIKTNPVITIMFLIAMTNPFIAYLLSIIEEKMKIGDISYAVLNLLLLILSQILFQNIWYILILSLILYKVIKTYNVNILDSLKEKIKNKILLEISGSIAINILACICFFASMRIN